MKRCMVGCQKYVDLSVGSICDCSTYVQDVSSNEPLSDEGSRTSSAVLMLSVEPRPLQCSIRSTIIATGDNKVT